MPHATPSEFVTREYDDAQIEERLGRGSVNERLRQLLLIATQPGALLECGGTFVVGILAAWDVAYRETSSEAWIDLVACVQAINFNEADAPEDFVNVAVPPLWRASAATARGTRFDCLPQQYVPLASCVGGNYRFHSLPVSNRYRAYEQCVNARLAAQCLRDRVGFEIPDLAPDATVKTETGSASVGEDASPKPNELLYFGFATRATPTKGKITTLECVNPTDATQEHYKTRAESLAAAAGEIDPMRTQTFEIPGYVDKFGYRYMAPPGGSSTMLAYLRPPMEGVPPPHAADPAFKLLVSTARTLPPSKTVSWGWMGLLSKWGGAVALTFVNYHDPNVSQAILGMHAPGLSLEQLQLRHPGSLRVFPPLVWPEVPQPKGKVVGEVPAAAMSYVRTALGTIADPDEMTRTPLFIKDQEARRKKVRKRVNEYLERNSDVAALCYMEWGVNSDKMSRFKSVSAFTMPPILSDRRQPVLSPVIVQSAAKKKCEKLGTPCTVAELRFYRDGLFTSLNLLSDTLSSEFKAIDKQHSQNSLLSVPDVHVEDYAVHYELPNKVSQEKFLSVFRQICKATFHASFDHMICRPCLFQILARKLSKKEVAQLWKDHMAQLAPPPRTNLIERVASAHSLLLDAPGMLTSLSTFLERDACKSLAAFPTEAKTVADPSSFDLLHIQMNLLSAVWYSHESELGSRPIFNYADTADTLSTPPVFLANMLPWIVNPDTVEPDTPLSVTARTAYKLRWVTITKGATHQVFELIAAGVLQPIPNKLVWGPANRAYRRELKWLANKPSDQASAFLCLDMVAPNRAGRTFELGSPFEATMKITFENSDAATKFMTECASAAAMHQAPPIPAAPASPPASRFHSANWKPETTHRFSANTPGLMSI